MKTLARSFWAFALLAMAVTAPVRTWAGQETRNGLRMTEGSGTIKAILKK